MKRSAEISECGRYRWTLRRDWIDEMQTLGVEPSECVFCGLNPSKADALINDATVRVWISFAKRWGYTAFTVVNAYPFRTTYPVELPAWYDGAPDRGEAMKTNREKIREVSAQWPGRTVVCWGANILPGDNADYLALEQIFGQALCLGLTKFGFPKHPLRLKLSTELIPYHIAVARAC